MCCVCGVTYLLVLVTKIRDLCPRFVVRLLQPELAEFHSSYCYFSYLFSQPSLSICLYYPTDEPSDSSFPVPVAQSYGASLPSPSQSAAPSLSHRPCMLSLLAVDKCDALRLGSNPRSQRIFNSRGARVWGWGRRGNEGCEGAGGRYTERSEHCF